MEKNISFEEMKEIISLKMKMNEEKHRMSMEELRFMRENDELHHQRELERGRIKSAEIKKTLAYKDLMQNSRRN